MNCDNTECKGKSKKYYDCILTSDFDSEACRWCEDCFNRDNDMVESYVEINVKNFIDTITDIELGVDGKVVAVKGKCKAKDLRRYKDGN